MNVEISSIFTKQWGQSRLAPARENGRDFFAVLEKKEKNSKKCLYI
jgi:hypothetical protein